MVAPADHQGAGKRTRPPSRTVARDHRVACSCCTLKWLNRVLDNALYHGEVLAEATCRGLIPAEEWQALETLATPKKKTAAVAKAQKLRALLA